MMSCLLTAGLLFSGAATATAGTSFDKKPATPPKTAPKTAAKAQSGTTAAKPAAAAEVAGPSNPNIRQIVSSKESMVQVSKDKDNWYFTLPDSLLGRLIKTVTRYTSTPAGFTKYGGEEVREQTVYFELSPDGKNLFLKSSILYSKSDTLDAINQAVNNSTSNPILQSFKLESGAPKKHYKINVTNLLLSENSFSLDRGAKSSMGVSSLMGGGASYIESVHAYPINIEVRTVRTYAASGGRLPSADETSMVTVGLNTSFVLLPKEPMRGRIFDPRVGYFTDSHFVFSDNVQKVERQSYITRWRLEPKDEDIEKMKRGELVEPKKQIVYYIDPATPKQWRPYLIAGVNDWNKAFERAGFKNAIVAKEWPDSNKDMSLEDARYSVIRYLASPIANAYGPNVSDPRSGEILESHIGWYHNVMTLVHDWYQIQAGNTDKRARSAKFDDDLMGQLIRFVSSHEVGHTLGLRHNFGSSSTVPVEKLRDKAWVKLHGHTPSIMDYARFNYVAQPEDGMEEMELFPRINDYDKWAIEWGYKPMFDATDSESDRYLLSQITTDSLKNNRRLWWGDGEGYHQDPRRQTEDLSDDAVKASEYGIKNLKAEVPHFQEWNYWGNDTEEENLGGIYNQAITQLMRYCGHVMRYVWGTYQNVKTPDEAGTIYSATPREKEKSVLPFFDRNIFTEPTWLIDVPYIDRITKDKHSVTEYIGSRVVSNLTSSDLLGSLNSNYPVQEYLPELIGMIFKEMNTGKPVDRYRRALQRACVTGLTKNFNSSKSDAPSDQLAMVLQTLKDLQTKAKAAARRTADAMTRAHYNQIADQIGRALSTGESSQASSGFSIRYGFTAEDNNYPLCGFPE
jgi:hypothetical protein